MERLACQLGLHVEHVLFAKACFGLSFSTLPREDEGAVA